MCPHRPYRLCRAAEPGAWRKRIRSTRSSHAASAQISLWLVEDGRLDDDEPVQATITYRAVEPYSVVLVYHQTEWEFARELLSQGLITAAGQGDVRIRSACSEADHEVGMVFTLTPEDGVDCLVEWWTPLEPVQRFLERTNALIPLGSEPAHPGLDATIARLLSSEPGEAGV
jgi:hypothetical protein